MHDVLRLIVYKKDAIHRVSTYYPKYSKTESVMNLFARHLILHAR
jgi:hypothetical protein